MKMMDCVEGIVEKEKYAKEGVHKGMQGVIWLEKSRNDEWDVYFPQYGENPDIAEISMAEEDIKQIPRMDARINEKIKEQFGE